MWLKQLWDSKVGGLSKKQLFGKCLYVFIGNVIASIGCALFIDSQLGSDPVSVLLDGMTKTFGISLGAASSIYTYTALFIALFFAFKYLNIGSIISSIIWSNVLGWADIVIRGIVGENLTLPTKLIMLGLGLLLMTVGLGIGVSARFGFGPMDSILFRISDKQPKAKYRYLKMCSDAIFMIIGFLMGGIVGLGTVCGFLLTGPGISFFIPLSNKYLLGAFDIQDKHNEKV